MLAVVLLPQVHAALRGDDTWISALVAHPDLGLSSYLGDSLRDARDQLQGGRLMPLAAFSGSAMTLAEVHSVPLYRALLLALTLLDAALLFVLLRRLGASRSQAALTLVGFAAFLQFRRYHDASLGYVGATQLVFALELLSLIAFHGYLRTGERRSLLWAILALLAALGLYEVAYPLVVLQLLLALSERRGRAALRASAPFLALGIGAVALTYALRLTSTTVPTGYTVSSGGNFPWTALRSYAIQQVPPLPTSAILFDPSLFGSHPTPAEWVGAGWRAVLLGGVSGGLLARLTSADAPRPPYARLAALGAGLWLLPVMLLALAGKYQTELGPSRGYLPVLIQVFGVAIVVGIAAVAVGQAAARRSGLARWMSVAVFAGLMTITAGVTWYANIRVIALERTTIETRNLGERAMAAGVLDGVPPRSTVLFDGRDLVWPMGQLVENPKGLDAWVRLHAGRLEDARQEGSSLQPVGFACGADGSFPPSDCSPAARQVAYVRIRAGAGGGTVIVSETMSAGAKDPAQRPAQMVWVYAQGRRAGRPPTLVGTRPDGRPWTSRALRWRTARRGGDWTIFTAPVAPRGAPAIRSLDDPQGLVDFNQPVAPDAQVRIYGARDALP